MVYVGRICRSMTHNELRERFSQFGEVEFVSLHFRERGYVSTVTVMFSNVVVLCKHESDQILSSLSSKLYNV